MKTNLHKRIGALTAVLVVAGAGLFATATSANAQSASVSGDVGTKAITTVFDLNGTYSDFGSVRPKISRVNDDLTVDMSSQGRPTAYGRVVNSTTIVVHFPDDAALTGTLYAPGDIRWNNTGAWRKLPYVTVPDVRGLTRPRAAAVLHGAGLRIGTTTEYTDYTCTYIGKVGGHSPRGGSSALAGSAVNVSIGKQPATPCP